MLKSEYHIPSLEGIIREDSLNRQPQPNLPAIPSRKTVLPPQTGDAVPNRPETGRKRSSPDPQRGENDLLD